MLGTSLIQEGEGRLAEEVYFWVRHRARNCPLEIVSALHSHLADEITEVQEEEQLAQDSDGLDMFSRLLIQPHPFLHSSEAPRGPSRAPDPGSL